MSRVVKDLPESEVLAKLAELGYHISTLSDLPALRVRYRTAIPVLIEALNSAEEPKLIEWLARCLSVPWARPAAVAPLIGAFGRCAAETGVVRWAIGSALEVVWDDDYFEDLARIATDRSAGTARQMVVLGLAKSKRLEATDVLLSLLGDPTVNGHAVEALRKMKRAVPEELIAPFLDDNRVWVRKNAKRILEQGTDAS